MSYLCCAVEHLKTKKMEPANDNVVLSDIKKLYDYHTDKAEMYRRVIEILTGNNSSTINEGSGSGSGSSSGSGDAKDGIKTKRARIKGRNMSFEDYVLLVLSDGKPRTTSEIKKEIEVRTNKTLSPKNVSSQLGNIRKNKGSIKSYNSSSDIKKPRNIWGLPDWFIGEELKDEYLNKIV